MQEPAITAPSQYLSANDFVARHQIPLDEFYAAASTFPRLLPKIVDVGGVYMLNDERGASGKRHIIQCPTQTFADESNTRSCISVSEFCGRFGLDFDALVRLQKQEALPKAYYSQEDGGSVVLAVRDVNHWSLARHAEAVRGA